MKTVRFKKPISKKKPEKALLVSLKRNAGRGSSGRITTRHKGGGAKKLYRLINFGQEKYGQKAKVLALEYDPYRTAFIALLQYEDGQKRYSLAPHGLKAGDEVIVQENAAPVLGNRLKLKNIPVGSDVHNIEIQPGEGGKFIRSAGSSAKILAQEGKFTHLEMPSKELRKVPQECYATVGAVSFPEHRYQRASKAGQTRHKGVRPRVRGIAMNPVDHPHGGGEGRSPIGMKAPKTPWGKIARGVKTRKRSWTNKYIIKRRVKKKK